MLFVVLSHHSCLRTGSIASSFWFISLHHNLSVDHSRTMLLFQHHLYLSWHQRNGISSRLQCLKQTTTQLAVGPILFSHQSQFLQAFGAQWVIVLNGDQSTVLLQHQSLKSLLEETLKQKHETVDQQHAKQLMGILTGDWQSRGGRCVNHTTAAEPAAGLRSSWFGVYHQRKFPVSNVGH